MATYIDLYNLIDDVNFDKRARFALYIAAQQAKTNTNQKVVNWGDAVLNERSKIDRRILKIRVLSTKTAKGTADALTDDDLQVLVNTLVQDFVIAEFGPL